MDLTYPAEAEAFRREVRAFLAAALPPGWTGVGSLPADEVGRSPTDGVRCCTSTG